MKKTYKTKEQIFRKYNETRRRYENLIVEDEPVNDIIAYRQVKECQGILKSAQELVPLIKGNRRKTLVDICVNLNSKIKEMKSESK